MGKEFQKHLSKEHCKHGVIDQGKYRKTSSKRKWTDREYHVQDNYDVAHKEVRMYCDKNQFPALPFCSPDPKLHGEMGLWKYYHFHFNQKLGHGICAISRIPCARVACKSIIDKPWIYGIPLKKSTLRTCHILYLLASSGIIQKLEYHSPNTKINTF